MTESIHFTICGHPVGYTRTTQRSKWSLGYQRYQDYKNAVVTAFLEQVPGNWGHPKPLTTTRESSTRIDCMIYFGRNKHPDPDNCYKAILDSLFVCDKYCSGSFGFNYDKNNPRVEVTIQ